MVSLHLHNVVLELLESVDVCHGCWRRIGAFERGLAFEARLRANHGGRQMDLPKFGAGTRHGGHGQGGLLDFARWLESGLR